MTLGSRRNLATAILIACGVGWAVLAAVDVTIALTTEGVFPTHPLHSLALATLITGTLSCLMVHAIRIGLVALRRLDHLDDVCERIERRLAMLEAAPAHGSAIYHRARGVAQPQRAMLAAAPTIDLAQARATRTTLKQQTVQMPLAADKDEIDKGWLCYQAGLADSAFPLSERDAEDEESGDESDGSSSVA